MFCHTFRHQKYGQVLTLHNFSAAFFLKLLHVNAWCMIKSCRIQSVKYNCWKVCRFSSENFRLPIKPDDVSELFLVQRFLLCTFFVFGCETCGLWFFPRKILAKPLTLSTETNYTRVQYGGTLCISHIYKFEVALHIFVAYNVRLTVCWTNYKKC